MANLLLLVVVLSTTLLALGVANQSFEYQDSDLESEEKLQSLFKKWIDHHEVSFHHTEKPQRYNVFKHNLKYVHEFNKKGGQSYKLGLNKFAALTHFEFAQTYASSKISHYRSLRGDISDEGRDFRYQESVKDLPQTIDWRQKNAVVEVKDQKTCGSCWAFSACGSVEGVNAICTSNLVSFSEQELLDCDTVDQGCNGGEMITAFKFIIKNGIVSEDSYPYEAENMSCKLSTKKNSAPVYISGYTEVKSDDEYALKVAVSQHPVSVAIAAGRDIQLYQSGIFNGSCSESLDHGVVVVGYGVAGGNHWIVKNSWGKSWGEKGYIRIQYGSNFCGIASQASYPTMKNCPAISLKDEL